MVRKRGSVTVYLSLTGILLFALFGTLIETARYTVCENHAARTLRTSAEGLFTEYSQPLFEHYGLFFLESSGTPFEQVIGRYAGDTMSAAGNGDMDFLEGSVMEIEAKQKIYAGDHGATALQKEINQYMGRIVTKEQVSKFLEDTKKLKHIEEDAQKIEETVKQEEQAAKLDVQLLKLMKLVDGISVSNGKISCETEFIKMFATKEKKGQNFGVTEGAVWKKMKPHIDDLPQTWDVSGKTTFLERVGRVKKLTEKAIEQGRKLSAEYQKIHRVSANGHDRMFAELIAALPVLNCNQEILAKTEELLRTKSVKEGKEELKILWEQYDTSTISFDYTGVSESGGADDPKDSFRSVWNKGILNLVCPSPSKLSSKAITNPDSFAELYREQEQAAEYGDRVLEFVSEDKVSLTGIMGDMGRYGMEEFCLDQYIERHFSGYGKEVKSWKQPLDYGWEYIVAGKASDPENLKAVLNRILLIRTVINFLALQRDSVRKKEAYAIAAGIVGFTGLAPLITWMQTLVLITWSLSESLVDLAALLQNRHVPVMKKPADIKTKCTQIVQLNHDAIAKRASKSAKEKKSSFGYKQYLLLFLALTKQSTRRYRVMDLIQCGMKKNGYTGFQFGSCVYQMKVKGEFVFPSRFFRMAPLEMVLGRSVQNCRIVSEVQAGY